MPLQLICPVCGVAFPADAGLQDAEARRALAVAMEIPNAVAAQVIYYLGMHAPPKRRIKWAKLTALISELSSLLESGQVTRNRETRAAPLAAWSRGLATVMEMHDAGKLSLPLEGHGLLCEIVFRDAAKADAQQAAASRPLHPSHHPAQLQEPLSAQPQDQPRDRTQPKNGEDWTRAKRCGAAHIGALLGAIKPTQPPHGGDDQ
jgi:hypothetical protein